MQIVSKDALSGATTLATFAEHTTNGTLSLHPFQAGDDHTADDDDDSAWVAKVTAMVVLFSVSMICGLAPFKLVRWFNIDPSSPTGKNHLFLVKLLLSFGGGALLSTVFLHLLPEINSSIEELVESGALPPPEDLPFPLGEFLLTGGFFMIYLVEEVVHWWMHRRAAKARAAAAVADGKLGDGKRNGVKHSHAHGHSHLPIGNITTVYPVTDIEGTTANGDTIGEPRISDDHEDDTKGSLRGLLIVLALSIHELFEGLAVGLERSSSTVWLLFGAVAAHKFVIAFCVAFELLVAAVRFRIAVAYIFVYSVVSAVGIGIGTALSSVGNDTSQTIEVLSVVLQGLASGTLIYVIFFEILAKDSGHSHGGGGSGGGGGGGHHDSSSSTDGLWQFLAVLVGFALLFGIMVASE